MRRTTHIDVIYTHTEGEPTCLVLGGIPWPAGTDIMQKRNFLEDRFDWIRHALLREPRGHADMYAGFVTPAATADADFGVIWCEDGAFNDMCGHGTIALSMVLASAGLVPTQGDRASVRHETTAGPIAAEAGLASGQAEWCRFENVPAYLAERDVPVELPGFGAFKADIAYGGNFYALIHWDHPEWKVRPENGHLFARLGTIARDQIRAKVRLQHPTERHIDTLQFVTFYQDSDRPEAFHRSVGAFGGGKLDRSPSGTGTSAMLAMYEARGRIKVGQPVRAEGLLGSGTFEGCLVGETTIGTQRAVIPTIKGKAHQIGRATWTIDPEDPLAEGFVIS